MCRIDISERTGDVSLDFIEMLKSGVNPSYNITKKVKIKIRNILKTKKEKLTNKKI